MLRFRAGLERDARPKALHVGWRVCGVALACCMVVPLVGCVAEKQGPEEPSKAPVGRVVAFTLQPQPDFSGTDIPRTVDGRPILAASSKGQLVYNPDLNDALVGLGRCVTWLAACLEPGTREMDDCVRSVPQCQGAQPWVERSYCCPAACYTTYAEARRGGLSEPDALKATYFGTQSCYPGVRALLENGR